MSNLLELRDLSIRYGSTQVLNSLKLTVGEREIVALLGPSGTGKSTLLNAVAGFLPIYSGEILLAGRKAATPGHSEPPERRDIAFVFQDYGLWPHLTALDTVAYPLRRRGVRRGPARDQARGILERLGIGALADRKPAQLSGGEQQRVGSCAAPKAPARPARLGPLGRGSEGRGRRRLVPWFLHRLRPARLRRRAAPAYGCPAGASTWGRGELVTGPMLAVPDAEAACG